MKFLLLVLIFVFSACKSATEPEENSFQIGTLAVVEDKPALITESKTYILFGENNLLEFVRNNTGRRCKVFIQSIRIVDKQKFNVWLEVKSIDFK